MPISISKLFTCSQKQQINPLETTYISEIHEWWNAKWKKKGGAAHLKSPSWYLPKACRMMVMTAMIGLTTQNWRVAWRIHDNSKWHTKRQQARANPTRTGTSESVYWSNEIGKGWELLNDINKFSNNHKTTCWFYFVQIYHYIKQYRFILLDNFFVMAQSINMQPFHFVISESQLSLNSYSSKKCKIIQYKKITVFIDVLQVKI